MAGSPLKGLEDALRRMENMRVGTKNKHIRKALRKAMVPIRDQAKENAKGIDDPETKERIWRNIQIQSGKVKGKGEIKYSVGVKGGAKEKGNKKRGPGGDTFYFRFIEFGTSLVKAFPFMRLAFSQRKNEAGAIFVAELKKGILEELR